MGESEGGKKPDATDAAGEVGEGKKRGRQVTDAHTTHDDQRQSARGEDRQTTAPTEGEGKEGDNLGYNPTPEDLHLREVHEDWVHANPGTHLDSGIRDGAAWQAWWHDVAVMPSRRDDAPSGRVERHFVGTLRKEL